MYKLIALFALFAVASAQILGGGLGLGGGWGWGGLGGLGGGRGIGGGLGGRVGGLGGLGGGIGGGRGGLGGLGGGLDGGWGWAYPAYKYSYGVTDKHTGDNKQASEVRNGAHTETQYSQNIVHG